MSGPMDAFKRLGKATQERLFDVASSALSGRPRRRHHQPAPDYRGEPQTRVAYPTNEVIKAAWGKDANGNERSQRQTARAAAAELNKSESQLRAMMRTGTRPRDDKTWNKMTRLGRERGGLETSQIRPRSTPPMSEKDRLNTAFSGSNKAAAEEFGVTPSAVAGWKRRGHIPDPEVRQRLSDRLIGQGHSEDTVSPKRDVDGMLMGAFGGDGRGVHASAAVKELGISPATLRGMRERGGPPRITSDPNTAAGRASRQAAHAFDKLVEQARAAGKSQSEQRRNIANAARSRIQGGLKRKREAWAPNRPQAKPPRVRVNIDGFQGVQTSYSDQLRDQVLSHPVDDKTFEDGMVAFEKGDAAYAKWLQDFGDDAVDGWQIESINDIWFDYDK